MKCLTCQKRLVSPHVAISHIISPGAKLCPDCGQRESLDPGWAEGMRLGFRRHETAVETRGIVARIAGEAHTAKHRRIARKKRRF